MNIHRVCVYKWAYCWVKKKKKKEEDLPTYLPYFSVAHYANTTTFFLGLTCRLWEIQIKLTWIADDAQPDFWVYPVSIHMTQTASWRSLQWLQLLQLMAAVVSNMLLASCCRGGNLCVATGTFSNPMGGCIVSVAGSDVDGYCGSRYSVAADLLWFSTMFKM